MDKYIFDPTGNVTVLVTLPVPVCEQASAAKEIFSEISRAEQVGFVSEISENNIALRMSGGEFCGNACMCAAALCAMVNGKDSLSVSVNISGAGSPVMTYVKSTSKDAFSSSVKMPPAIFVGETELLYRGEKISLPLVSFDGISHLIISGEIGRQDAESVIKEWCDVLGTKSLGLMFYDTDKKSLLPLVYVKESDALYWEGSCASGTAAVAEYLYYKTEKDVNLSLLEPCGNLSVSKTVGAGATLSGSVHFIGHDKSED